MTFAINTPKSDNLDAYVVTTGVKVEAARAAAAKGCTLANSTTYYFPIGGSETEFPGGAGLLSIHLQWAAAVAAVFTLEVSDFPAKVGGTAAGASDVTDYSAVAGEWLQVNPSTAYVPVTGTGNSVSSATVTAGGTNAGGALLDVSALGSRRVRIKAVVTTGGVVRVGAHGKAG
jgi:hypothetical protein